MTTHEITDDNSTAEDISLEEIQKELEEMGIDVPQVVRAIDALSRAESLIQIVGQGKTANTSLSPDLIEWSQRVAKESILEPAVLKKRLWGVGAILAVGLVTMIGMVIVFAMDLVILEMARFIGVSVMGLSMILIVAASLILVQLLWGAYVFGRVLSGAAIDSTVEMRDVMVSILEHGHHGMGNATKTPQQELAGNV